MPAKEARLMQTQKNEIFPVIQGFGFDPAQFRWDEDADFWEPYDRGRSVVDIQYRVSKLVHIPSSFYAKFGNQYIEMSPGNTSLIERSVMHKLLPDMASLWLTYLKREVAAPDLWAIAIQSKEFASVATQVESDNTTFSTGERKYIVEKLAEIEKYLVTTDQVNSDHREFVHLQFKYLAESAERLGRKDWKNNLVGVITNIVIAVVFAPQRTQELFTMIASAFLPLFKHVLQLPAVPIS